ncbi:hypothetical protein FB45DRAFT_1102956 [Roridomyces roridus]|uniref:Uncharacterized protein n=1 Tax=Roridomyces roridus TaxID=1738132 RepID=A0AAD7BD57_9AGAR|nr:hypothetical protein FB45DRAFT_1102956 [Roridomyces roridus]
MLFLTCLLLNLALLFRLGCADSIPVAPAPWVLDVSEGYIFVVLPPLSPAFLPPGWANPLEEPELRPGSILPDIGLMMLVRYAAGPVGPYDELIYIPGRWAYNLTDSGLRITQIYVSTNASVFNGRTNWNIPKHLAVFNFTSSTDGSTSVTVSPPDDLAHPHFAVNLTPTIGPIPIQVNSTLTGNHWGCQSTWNPGTDTLTVRFQCLPELN